MLTSAIFFDSVHYVVSGRLLFERIRVHEVSDRFDAPPIVKSYSGHSASRKNFHRHSLRGSPSISGHSTAIFARSDFILATSFLLNTLFSDSLPLLPGCRDQAPD